jgi:hypothetical protein
MNSEYESAASMHLSACTQWVLAHVKKKCFHWRHVWMQNSLSAKNPDVPSMRAAVLNIVAEVLVVGFLSVLRVDYYGDCSYSYCKKEEC